MKQSICCEIIKTCPLQCKHCSANSHNYTSLKIPFSDLKQIIYEAKENNINTFFISGGEPLLHPDLFKIIKFIKDLEIEPFLYSSGCISDFKNNNLKPISKNNFKNLIDSGLDGIAFSLFSLNSNIHNAITQTEFSHETLLNTIENAQETIKKLNIELNFLPLKSTYKEIKDIVYFSKKMHISKINIHKFIYQGRAKTTGIINEMLTKQQEADFISTISKLAKETKIKIEISKLYDCDTYDSLLISPYTSGINESFITYKQEILLGRKYRDEPRKGVLNS